MVEKGTGAHTREHASERQLRPLKALMMKPYFMSCQVFEDWILFFVHNDFVNSLGFGVDAVDGEDASGNPFYAAWTR